jgi:antirestriction protein
MNTTNTLSASPRLYVGTYAKYNSGSIKGAWLSLEDYADRAAFLEACAELHADEVDPEIMFQDFEGFPSWYSESSAPADILWEWLELDENEREAFGGYADNFGGDASIEDFRDAYRGQWESGAAFAENTAEECGEVPQNLPAWIVIDWEASWNCNLRHDYFTADGSEGIHIFCNC